MKCSFCVGCLLCSKLPSKLAQSRPPSIPKSSCEALQVSRDTLVPSGQLLKQRGPPPPAGAALGERLIRSPALCGTCPAHDSSTGQVFSTSRFLCFVRLLLLAGFAVCSVNRKSLITVGVYSGGCYRRSSET